ncbi:hypothetical protein T01_9495 [Trichinella spiralis]|uniref:Uncharacterized protein n=1 Tax=Trichinella spiralis TaxID=6334 RepID=A0A0V1C2K1_TRISP|nr:hypothetical protein T01_9495 [Trichinella spiralis]
MHFLNFKVEQWTLLWQKLFQKIQLESAYYTLKDNHLLRRLDLSCNFQFASPASPQRHHAGKVLLVANETAFKQQIFPLIHHSTLVNALSAFIALMLNRRDAKCNSNIKQAPEEDDNFQV